jgi:hypothetical protein
MLLRCPAVRVGIIDGYADAGGKKETVRIGGSVLASASSCSAEALLVAAKRWQERDRANVS